MKKVLDSILEKALEQALASLTGKAAAIVEQALEQALEARVKALLEDEDLTPAIEAPTRAKAKAAMVEATPTLAKEEATPKVRRRKAEAKATPKVDLATLMGSVEAALSKYSGLTTPKGKALPEVLSRRVRRVLQYAQALGREDLAALARSAVAVIGTNPMGYAMGAWPALAVALGLPDPIQAKVVGE